MYVKLCGTDSGVLLSIEDNGPVKTIRELTDITEKLASTKENGLGLGLQIVKGIAEHHRAKLDFKVRDQNGVAVSVFFPRDLENGQCLMQDLYGRVGVVQIHPVFVELLHAFDTRPPIKSEVDLE